jgi:nitrate/TMAO reductase-like tetraheme cytochrome c subunit
MAGFSIFRKTIIITFVIGAVAGVIVALIAEKVDHLTSTEEFCTSCHAMQSYIASSETYKTSTHQTTSSGVRPGCADCHIPSGLVYATYTHMVNGASDLWGEISHDYDNPATWEAEKGRLAYAARDWFRDNDSVTCRECHEEASIKPQRKRGQTQHAEARESGTTCIECHYNLVHEEIEPRESFLQSDKN